MKLIVIALVLVFSASIGHAAGERSPEVTETILDLHVIHALLEARDTFVDTEIVRPRSPITIDEFAKRFPKEIGQRMARRDGWGTEFMVGTFQSALFVVSAGEDQVHDTISAMKTMERPPHNLEGLVGDDIFLSEHGEVWNIPTTLWDRQRKTIHELLLIGTALDSFSIDKEAHPRQDNLLPVETLRELLAPIYIRKLPLIDAWGNQYRMWGTERDCVVLSTGADGKLDRDYGLSDGKPESVGRGPTVEPADDIISVNNKLVQWPEGMKH